MGVYGNSKSTKGGAGVMGEAVGPGVWGKSQTWHGVYGESLSTTGGAGVWGEHKGAGVGAVGISATGVGVFGKGGRLAAQFEGNVDISGNLIIQGVSIQGWLQRIIALEQRDNNLQQQIISLNQQVNNLQQQLASVQQKEIADRQDEVTGIQILAARVTRLGG
jgi:hypothetical protein